MVNETQLLQIKSIGDILTRIGFGPYQNYVFIVLGLIYTADGAELILVVILSLILPEVWDLNGFYLGIMSGIIFLGMMIGTFLATFFGDDHGRIFLLRIALGILLLGGISSAAMPEFWSFSIARAICGIGIGMSIPILTAYNSEVCPAKLRGSYIIIVNIFFPLGQVLIILLAFALTPNLDGGQWRLLVFLAAMPILIGFTLLFFNIVESPAQLAKQEKYNKAIQSLNYIAKKNDVDTLDDHEEQVVYSVMTSNQYRGVDKLRIILSEENKEVTYKLVYCWFVAIMSFYGLVFIVPMAVPYEGPMALLLLLVLVIVDIPAVFISSYLINPETMGRKNSLRYSILITGVFFTIAGILAISMLFFVTFLLLAKVGIVIYFSTLFPFTSELYQTEVRSMSIGFCSIFGRLAGAVTPIIMIALFMVYPGLPFVFLGIVCMFTYYLTRDLPDQPYDDLVENN